MDNTYVIVGLGNPGRKYRFTRHNVGFMAVDLLSVKHNIRVKKIGFKGLYGKGEIHGEKVIILKPQTYMNDSGESIREIIEYYKIKLENLIIIYDDIDLPVGSLRIRAKGSSGTHNGMKSIIYQLENQDFQRIRIGIGKPDEHMDLKAYVLGKFTKEQEGIIAKMVLSAVVAVETTIDSGIQAAMAKCNIQINNRKADE